AIDIDPNLALAWATKGFAYAKLKKGDYIAAMKYYSKALELNPDNYIARSSKKNIYATAKVYGIRLCWRCCERLTAEFDPLPYWGFLGPVCESCFGICERSTQFFKVKYLERRNDDSKKFLHVDGVLMVSLFDGQARTVFEPSEKNVEPIVLEHIKDVRIIEV